MPANDVTRDAVHPNEAHEKQSKTKGGKGTQSAAPFHVSRTGSNGRSKSSRNAKTNASPPTPLALEVESLAVMVKLARVPAVMMDSAVPETTVVDAHVVLAKSKVCAKDNVARCDASSSHATPQANRKADA